MKKIIILLFICLSLAPVGAVSALEGFSDVGIHGFISQGYIQSNEYDYSGIKTEDGSFEFNEMGINFSTTPADGLRVGAQIFARDFGELGNDEFELDWAYGDYRVNNYFGVRAGKVKIALGLYNETRDVDAVRTSIMLPNAIYVEQNRDVYAGIKGVGAYGELPGGFSYQLAYGVGGVSEESNLLIDMTTILEDRLKKTIQTGFTALYGQAAGQLAATAVNVEIGTGTDPDTGEPNKTTPFNTQNASLQWAPRFAEGLRLSGTWLFTEIDTIMYISTPSGFTFTDGAVSGVTTTTDRTEVPVDNCSSIVGSIEYTRGDTILSAEYNMIRVDVGNVLIMGTPTDIATTEVLGWAVSASHRFTYWFELGAYYGDWVTNDRDRDGSEMEEVGREKEERWMRDACLTTRFDLNENWIFKLEGHYMNGLDDVDYGNDPDPDPDWFLFASKVSYNF